MEIPEPLKAYSYFERALGCEIEDQELKQQIEQAFEICKKESGAADDENLNIEETMVQAKGEMNNGSFDSAKSLYGRALKKSLADNGEEHEVTASCYLGIGLCDFYAVKWDDSE
mmetsp:Transcript_12440/g.10710  ORF Transcript_12440/g.10710 Transcript_12440/m.10710 type:complete len:114 (+) Transcript_12440:472-813(+)